METDNSQLHMTILEKLSVIDKNLAVNTAETANIKARISDMQTDTKETKVAVQVANGRTTKLEQWSNEAKVIIEKTTTIATRTAENYSIDKTRLWSSIGVLVFLGGTIITLAIMAINSKIKDGINEALSQYEVTVDK